MVGDGRPAVNIRGDGSIYIIVESYSPILFSHPHYNLTTLREVGCNRPVHRLFSRTAGKQIFRCYFPIWTHIEAVKHAFFCVKFAKQSIFNSQLFPHSRPTPGKIPNPHPTPKADEKKREAPEFRSFPGALSQMVADGKAI